MKLANNRISSLESRIRDIKRQLLHQKDKTTRKIWVEHINFLDGQIKSTKGVSV